MSTENNSLPVAVIDYPVEYSPVNSPVSVSGHIESTAANDQVQVVKVGGNVLFAAAVSKDGQWQGTLPSELPGVVAITARLIRGDEFSSWSPTRTFTVV